MESLPQDKIKIILTPEIKKTSKAQGLFLAMFVLIWIPFYSVFSMACLVFMLEIQSALCAMTGAQAMNGGKSEAGNLQVTRAKDLKAGERCEIAWKQNWMDVQLV